METTGLKPTDLAYMAGFFDGEGCVLPDAIQVDNTCPHPLELFRDTWGGKIILKKKQNGVARTQYRWVSYGETARTAARDMLPYLKEKKSQAEIFLTMLEYPKASAPREYCVRQLKFLKRIDYDDYARSG